MTIQISVEAGTLVLIVNRGELIQRLVPLPFWATDYRTNFLFPRSVRATSVGS